MQANFGPAAAWGLGGVRGPLGAAGLARRPVCREVRGRAGEGSWPWWSGIQDCPVVVPGWVPSISPELAFLPCVEGLLAEREGDASLCTMIPAAGSRQQPGRVQSGPFLSSRPGLTCPVHQDPGEVGVLTQSLIQRRWVGTSSVFLSGSWGC